MFEFTFGRAKSDSENIKLLLINLDSENIKLLLTNLDILEKIKIAIASKIDSKLSLCINCF